MSEFFTISPAGFILEYDPSPGSMQAYAFAPQPGFILSTRTVGQLSVPPMGAQGILKLSVTTGSTGMDRALAFLVDSATSPTRFLGLGLDSQNRVTAWLLDTAGTTIGQFVSATPYPTGVDLVVELSWNASEALEDAPRNASVKVNGYYVLGWTTDPSSSWVPFSASTLLVGHVGGSGFQSLLSFNGTLLRAELSHLSWPPVTSISVRDNFDIVLSDTVSVTDHIPTDVNTELSDTVSVSDDITTFVPSDITGNVFWLRADLGITLNGGDVSAWGEQSGSGNSCNQATAGQQPLFVASDAGFNSQPVVSFTGANTDTLVSASDVTYGPYTWFVVAGALSVPNSYFLTRVNGAAYCETLYGTTPANYTFYRSDGTGVSTIHNSDVNWGSIAGTKTIVATMNGTHAGHKLYVNGVDKTTDGASVLDPGVATTVGKIHLANDPLFAAPGTLKMAEVLIYNRALSDAERARVESYLRTRYAHY